MAGRIARIGFAAAALATLAAAAGLIAMRLLLGWYPMVVYTGSMAPTIPIGAVVVVQPVPADALVVGDVISFRAPQTGNLPVTHRIVEVERLPATAEQPGGWQVITQGDANRAPDVWRIGEQQITGRVGYSIPSIGYALVGIAQPAVRNAIVGVIGVLFLARVARRLRPSNAEERAWA